MIRTTFLRTALLLGSLGIPLLACGGRVVSIGSNVDQLKSIDPSNVTGTAGACPAGYQHPNICCSGGPSEASACGAYINKPFRPCDPGSITYPNPLSCCSLTDGTCIDAPPGDAGPPPPNNTCTYACPPGWWVPPTGSGNANSGSSGGDTPVTSPNGGSGQPTPASGECCHTLPDGSMECEGWASASPVSTPPSAGCVDPTGPIDAGVAEDASFDGGADGEVLDGGAAPDADVPPPYDAGTGCGDVDGGTPPPAPPPWGTCDLPCPQGWTADPSAPAVCCRALPDGDQECFSQAYGGPTTGPIGGPDQPPVAVDAGVTAPSGRACGGSAPVDGGPSSCECSASNSGAQYDLKCDDTTESCQCIVNGQVEKTVPSPFNSMVCSVPSHLDTLWTQCGFPQ